MSTQFFQKQIAKFPVRWKLATLRCTIYALIVGWGAFEVGTQGYNALSEMTQMQIIYLFGGIVSAMLGVWLAFLDQSLSGWNQNHPTPPAAPPSAPGNATR